MKKSFTALLVFLSTFVQTAIGINEKTQTRDTLMYRITFADKGNTPYSLLHPEQFLSAKAIKRRQKQGISIDSTDLPVCTQYLHAIQRHGLRIVTKGKWENFVTVACNDTTLIQKVAALPFVSSTQRVWIAPPTNRADRNYKRDSLLSIQPTLTEGIYGTASEQIKISEGDKLHAAGFTGQGMTIAVIDAGFHNVDTIASFKQTNIIGVKDFVRPDADIYAESNHGTHVLSCIGMNQPHMMVGTAPQADFWLLRSEDEYSEHLVEQDYWAAAIEFADSVGVDVVNTSLGYYSFDDPSMNYELRHLDGKYSLMSRQASRMASKGMILVCSAGNSGAGSWKKITPPADAQDVIAVGAIRKNGKLAPFSSIGNTTDGRIKPDVVAIGESTDIINTHGIQGKANGTSFASPIVCGLVTCLWQALPHYTALEIINLIRNTSNRAAYPDNVYGYGIPNVWKAYLSATQE